MQTQPAFTISPEDLVRAHCRRRFRHGEVLKNAMLHEVECLFQGHRAVLLERSNYSELREEILWICFSMGASLSCEVRR